MNIEDQKFLRTLANGLELSEENVPEAELAELLQFDRTVIARIRKIADEFDLVGCGWCNFTILRSEPDFAAKVRDHLYDCPNHPMAGAKKAIAEYLDLIIADTGAFIIIQQIARTSPLLQTAKEIDKICTDALERIEAYGDQKAGEST